MICIIKNLVIFVMLIINLIKFSNSDSFTIAPGLCPAIDSSKFFKILNNIIKIIKKVDLF
jgi:hypothetical protein